MKGVYENGPHCYTRYIAELPGGLPEHKARSMSGSAALRKPR